MKTKYEILTQILDSLRAEARGTKWSRQYAVDEDDNSDAVAAARARSYIHLYIKVMFGLSDFADREAFVTDGPQDGGGRRLFY
jgi:hypothetical protein